MNGELELRLTRSEYRVLILADIQERPPVREEQLAALREVIDRAQPDLAILLGDMVFGPVTHRKSAVFAVIDAIDGVLREKGIDYLVVSGNHDMDSLTPWRAQLERYVSKPRCLSPGVGERDCEGAFSARLLRQDGSPLSRFLFFDGGKTVLGRYGVEYLPVGEEELAWEREKLRQDGLDVYVFQHIPVKEIYSLLRRVPKQSGAVRGRGCFRGAWLLPEPSAMTTGTLGEAPCPAWADGPQFSDWINSGRVRAAFFGHDHKNDLAGTLSGIRLIYTPTAGLYCYGTDALRGARLLRFGSEGGFETEMLYYGRKTGEEDEP